jgi:hypothetical protein
LLVISKIIGLFVELVNFLLVARNCETQIKIVSQRVGRGLTKKYHPVPIGRRCHPVPGQGKAPYERIDRDVARRYELVSRIGRGLGPQQILPRSRCCRAAPARCYGVVFEVMLRDRLIRENKITFLNAGEEWYINEVSEFVVQSARVGTDVYISNSLPMLE